MKKKRIIMLADDPSHPAGYHEYVQSSRLFKVALEQSNVGQFIEFEYCEKGWPEDESVLETADLIVAYTDGRDGEMYHDVPFVEPARMKRMDSLMRKGCGLMLMHFSTFFSNDEKDSILEWVGGYFSWQNEQGDRDWFSKICHISNMILLSNGHPVTRGVSRTLCLNDEIYYNIKFKENDPRVVPVGIIQENSDSGGYKDHVVAWAIEREDGGRGFGTSLGHAYRLWKDEHIRRFMLNAMVWTAGIEVPFSGVQARFYSDAELNKALHDISGSQRSHPIEDTIRILLLSGNEHHKWHNWEETEPAIVAALTEDHRMKVDVVHEAEAFSELDLFTYDVIVMNYCNWYDPVGLSERAKVNLLHYLEHGGGMAVLHFSNGSFHFSLPEAGASDWPEFRAIAPRVWNHHGASGHDAYGLFQVCPTDSVHPITKGIAPFQIEDELYFNQEGDLPIEVLCTGYSQSTQRHEPLVWLHQYRSARVFQSLLGHSAASYASKEMRQMLRRGILWAAQREFGEHEVDK